MIRKIQYFHSVVRNNSFSQAAEECHISQSAISQQIQALEQELGFPLLKRENRRFELTPAGAHFYEKTLILLADFDRICRESVKIYHGDEVRLRVGYLRSYSGGEFRRALKEFSERYPGVTVEIICGNHEELFDCLRTEQADLVLNDQRRAFSDEYVNCLLSAAESSVEVASCSPLGRLTEVEPWELKNTPCILVSSDTQRENEMEYYRTVMGFQGEFLFAQTVEEARLLVIGGRGFMPVEGNHQSPGCGEEMRRIPLVRSGKPITRNYCAFWKQDNSGYYIEEFAEMLKRQFAEGKTIT